MFIILEFCAEDPSRCFLFSCDDKMLLLRPNKAYTDHWHDGRKAKETLWTLFSRKHILIDIDIVMSGILLGSVSKQRLPTCTQPRPYKARRSCQNRPDATRRRIGVQRVYQIMASRVPSPGSSPSMVAVCPQELFNAYPSYLFLVTWSDASSHNLRLRHLSN